MQFSSARGQFYQDAMDFTLPLAGWFVFVPAGDIKSAYLQQIDPLYRRRLSRLSKMVIVAAASCLPEQVPQLYTILASRHGEICNTVNMLRDLAGKMPLSPAAFSVSVHSAAVSFLSIARADHSSFTAISAGQETLFAALQEAAGQLAKDPSRSLLLICADEVLPEELGSFRDSEERNQALALYFNAVTARKEMVVKSLALSGERDLKQPAIAFSDFLESGKEQFTWNGSRLTWKIRLNDKTH
jgi:hypothetical protein